jgi:hypothetical protein
LHTRASCSQTLFVHTLREIKTAALAGLLPASVAVALGYPIKAERQL